MRLAAARRPEEEEAGCLPVAGSSHGQSSVHCPRLSSSPCVKLHDLPAPDGLSPLVDGKVADLRSEPGDMPIPVGLICSVIGEWNRESIGLELERGF